MEARTHWSGWRRTLAIGLAAGLVLVGCGDGEDSPTAPAQTTGTPPPEAGGEVGAETEPTGNPAPGEQTSTVQVEPTDDPARAEGDTTGEAQFVAPPSESLGVYVGAGNADGVERFGAWLGNDLDRALDYIDGSTWSTIESPDWMTSRWAGSGYRVDFSVPMIPDAGGSLAIGAQGGYNAHFVELAENLVDGGHGGAIIRPGWEFNLAGFSWYAGSQPRAYAAYFRQIVSSMRSVPGQQFEFEWNPLAGPTKVAVQQAYPGDRFVDYIGLDIYDQSWIRNRQDPRARWKHYLSQPYGLRWHRAFAARRGKPMTFPEWGVSFRPDGHGGGDSPYFIQRMHEWIRTNNVAAHYYFEFDSADGDHQLLSGQFPRSAARFRELFG